MNRLIDTMTPVEVHSRLSPFFSDTFFYEDAPILLAQELDKLFAPTPQTPKDWEHLTGLTIARDKSQLKTIAELQEEVKKLRQKLKNSHRVPKSDIKAMTTWYRWG